MELCNCVWTTNNGFSPFHQQSLFEFCHSIKLEFNWTMLLVEVKSRSYRIPSSMTVIFVLLPIIFMMVISGKDLTR